MVRKQPRPYQLDCINAILRAYGAGKMGVVIEAFTGFGKGVVIAMLSKIVREQGGRVLILVNRDNLCNQLHASVREQGLFPVMERGQDKASPMSDCVIGSIQTMQGNRLKKWRPDWFQLVITDEAHGAAADTFLEVLNYFAPAKHLGLSATIERHDKAGLWKGYEECVFTMTLSEGINEGWLVPFEFEEIPVAIAIEEKLSKKKMWTEADEIGVFNKDEVLPVLFEESAIRSVDNHGLLFWPNCKTSEEAANVFRSHGIDSRHVDGYMKDPDILEILEWFATPGPKTLHNADLLSVGYDNPLIDLIGIMRLSRSIPTLKQRLGRGTRPVAPVDKYNTAELRRLAIDESSKPKCKVLDLMLQLGDGIQNTFATPSALITSNSRERAYVQEQMRKGKFSMEELATKLRSAKSQMDKDEALAKVAEDTLNSLKKNRNESDGPYVGDIFIRLPKTSKSEGVTKSQYGMLQHLGCKIPREDITKLQASQLINRFKRHNERMKKHVNS